MQNAHTDHHVIKTLQIQLLTAATSVVFLKERVCFVLKKNQTKQTMHFSNDIKVFDNAFANTSG